MAYCLLVLFYEHLFVSVKSSSFRFECDIEWSGELRSKGIQEGRTENLSGWKGGREINNQ